MKPSFLEDLKVLEQDLALEIDKLNVENGALWTNSWKLSCWFG